MNFNAAAELVPQTKALGPLTTSVTQDDVISHFEGDSNDHSVCFGQMSPFFTNTGEQLVFSGLSRPGFRDLANDSRLNQHPSLVNFLAGGNLSPIARAANRVSQDNIVFAQGRSGKCGVFHSAEISKDMFSVVFNKVMEYDEISKLVQPSVNEFSDVTSWFRLSETSNRAPIIECFDAARKPGFCVDPANGKVVAVVKPTNHVRFATRANLTAIEISRAKAGSRDPAQPLQPGQKADFTVRLSSNEYGLLGQAFHPNDVLDEGVKDRIRVIEARALTL